MKLFEKLSSKNIPQARLEVERMTPYSAPLEGRRGFLRLDFNENTIGPSPKVLEAIKNITSEEISIYPEYQGLKEVFAEHINSSVVVAPIKSNQVGLFNGVDAAIHAIFHSYGEHKGKLLTTVPTFGYYYPCASMQGMEVIEVPYKEKNFQFPYDAIYKLLIDLTPKILMICNPNNPTGTSLPAKKVLELAKASPETLVVIDELYEAFLGDSVLSVVDFNQIPNLIVLRSLSKTSGLAGLRMGFAIGDSRIIDRISRVTGPYDVNSFAVTAAFAALKDQKYIDNYVAEVLEARLWIQKKLMEGGVQHHIGAGNYFLLWPKRESKSIENCLKSSGILVRNMQQKHLITGSLRVSIGTTDQMKSFWEIYKKADQVMASD
ncbi:MULTISPECIES: pyridoxal phosphate-dependent aminotransferase [unclassified Prochlorococcus]|uniref:pyridoxal phosphate-dependent aminotransferase n=1 Tax=unclassified Prochlorococcus TaxID=2627481 RepID=UPI0005338EDC|nr:MULTISPECIES: histidinol-phosphate transaminase [unclassified Prochlorococcus]KGG16751.1 Histidinol-phosphate aminotransferase [Prochlorococcus sp. MIT 0602]KGG18275.1 Histidinol-phosphate aminotransferase [Prochlorococcus sp. MIT 0603]